MSRGRPPLALAALLAVAGPPGCGPPPPAPHTRIAGWSPRGSDAPLDALVTVDFTAPVSSEGLAEGLHVALTRAADARAVARALEAGEAPGLLAVACDVALVEGGRPYVVLRGGWATRWETAVRAVDQVLARRGT